MFIKRFKKRFIKRFKKMFETIKKGLKSKKPREVYTVISWSTIIKVGVTTGHMLQCQFLWWLRLLLHRHNLLNHHWNIQLSNQSLLKMHQQLPRLHTTNQYGTSDSTTTTTTLPKKKLLGTRPNRTNKNSANTNKSRKRSTRTTTKRTVQRTTIQRTTTQRTTTQRTTIQRTTIQRTTTKRTTATTATTATPRQRFLPHHRSPTHPSTTACTFINFKVLPTSSRACGAMTRIRSTPRTTGGAGATRVDAGTWIKKRTKKN